VKVFEDRLHKIVINEDGISSLIFDATARSDAGHYTCIARNRAGEDRFQVNLNVTGTVYMLLARVHTHTHTHTRLTRLFVRDYPGEPVPET